MSAADPDQEWNEDEPTTMGGPSLNLLTQSLGLQALVHLGERPLPGSDELSVDLAQAKYTIDLLQMLRDKTAGNRTEDEEFTLDRLLYDLRMKYVARGSGS